ncbi:MAG: aldehyde dehydrogenase family protein [Saprospiraceae bacterium]|nr:aldehyde dehydrogenase family protein [Saprospiraceae bacterium]
MHLNYPVNLVFIPLVGAISAGNTVMVKPAHETEFSCNIIDKIIKEVFDPWSCYNCIGRGFYTGSFVA